MVNVVLIGHDTRNANLGVGALTVSNIEIIHAAAKQSGVPVEVTILIGASDMASCVSRNCAMELVVRPLKRPWQFFKYIQQADLVIDISGGDSFSDIYGNRRIFQILLQQFLTHIARRQLIMAPQTMGPFKNRIWRMLAAVTVRKSAVVATRDDKSTAYLREIGVKRPIIEASDVALQLPFEAPTERTLSGPPFQVGLNVSGLLMNGGYTGKNMFGLRVDYPKLIRRLISGFQAHSDECEVHLISHVVPLQRGGIEDDYQTSLDLAEEFPDCVVAPAFKTPSEAKNYIARLDFFMGARMHACIAAFSSGVPMVPMAYSRKFDGLFGCLGYNRVVDCTAESADVIADKIFAAFDKRKQLKIEMRDALSQGQRRLSSYIEALEETFRSYGSE